MQAVGTRYSGTYDGLPRVSYWEIWNEPNFGEDLAPQANANSSVLVAAPMYRSLVDAAWPALVRTGHGHDTTILGSLDARGMSGRPSRFAPQGCPGNFAATKPLQFVRAIVLRRPRLPAAARERRARSDCPTTAAGTRGFRRAHPALFRATAFADHPYPVNLPASRLSSRDPGLRRIRRDPPSGQPARPAPATLRIGPRRFPIYNNEFGYITNPPNHNQPVTSPLGRRAYYLNWAEYLSWRNPRIASYMQYLLYDSNPAVNVPEYGGFATGLLLYDGTGCRPTTLIGCRYTSRSPRPGAGRELELWGCARPAYGFAQPQVAIEFQRGSHGPFTTLGTVEVTDPHGYFDLPVQFPASGSVRLAWTYPPLGPPPVPRDPMAVDDRPQPIVK